jgi:hypothetical protein
VVGVVVVVERLDVRLCVLFAGVLKVVKVKRFLSSLFFGLASWCVKKN